MNFFWLHILLFVLDVTCDTTIIYDTTQSTFQNWTLYYLDDSGSIVFPTIYDKPLSLLDIDLTEKIDLNSVFIVSPLINVEPALKLYNLFGFELYNNASEKIVDDDFVNIAIAKYGDLETALKYKVFLTVVPANALTSDVTPEGKYYPYWYLGFRLRIYQNKNKKYRTFRITQLKVTYKSCPSVTTGLAIYQHAPSVPDNLIQRFVTEGKCVQNAESDNEFKRLNRICKEDGTSSFDGGCRCTAGYEETNNRTECKKCEAGQFRSEKLKESGVSKCQKCGRNSLDSDSNKNCNCQVNYYRYQSEEDDSAKSCYQHPKLAELPPPDFLNDTSIKVRWNPPIYTDVLPLTYTVECVRSAQCFNPVKLQDANAVTAIIENLLPYTEYEYKACVNTAVSLSRSQTVGNCQTRTKTTLEGAPSGVRNVRVNNIDCSGVYEFRWEPPITKGGPTMRYIIRCPGQPDEVINDSDKTTASVRVQSSAATIKCQIITNSNKYHTPVDTSSFVTCDQASLKSLSSKSIGGIVAGVIICVVIIAILILAFIYRRQQLRRKQAMSERDREELIMQAVRELMNNRTTNLYVRAALDHEIVDLDGEEPVYEAVIGKGYFYPYNKLKKTDELGEGNFAKVYQAEAHDICGSSGKSIVAVKELKLHECDEVDIADFEGELQLMQELKSHPNVVRLLGICPEPNRCMIVEYLPGGDLLTFLLKSRQYRSRVASKDTAEGSYLTAEDLLEFAHEISLGMEHISNHGIVHRDLACRNILVGYQRVCKVGDLGLARKLNDQGIYRREKQAKLPVKWLPPESIRYGRSSVKSDVWSFGILLWEIVTIGGVPYPDKKSRDVPQLLKVGYRMPKPDHCDDDLYELMSECWNESEDLRPSFLQISKRIEDMRHGLKSYINLKEYNDDAYLPLNDADIEFQDVDFERYDDNGFIVQHIV